MSKLYCSHKIRNLLNFVYRLMLARWSVRVAANGLKLAEGGAFGAPTYQAMINVYLESKSFCHHERPAFGKVLLWAGFLSGYLYNSFFKSVTILFNSALSALISTKYSVSSFSDCGRNSRLNLILNIFLSASKSLRSSNDRLGSVKLMSVYSG